MGADAVVSALGPIAEETTTEISDATRTIVEAMERPGPRRIVIAANAKVFDDSEVTGPYANVAAEHRRDAAILRGSRLDWTVLAAPMLTDDAATGAVVPVVDGKAPGRSSPAATSPPRSSTRRDGCVDRARRGRLRTRPSLR